MTVERRAVGAVLVMALVACLLSVATLMSSYFGVNGDQPYHYHAARAFLRCLEEGELFPRWAGVFDGGRGNPLFTFYPPLYYLLTCSMSLLFGFSILTSMKCVVLFSFFIGQLSAYFFARRFFNTHLSLLVGVAYVLLPSFGFIAFHCSFLPNLLAVAIAPLALLGAYRLLAGDGVALGLVTFAVAASAVVLTHVLTAFLLFLSLGIMIVAWLTRDSPKGVLRLLGGGVLVLALTAFFWVPLLCEMPWVDVKQELANHRYANYFLFAPPADSSSYRRSMADSNYAGSLIVVLQSSLVFILALGSLTRRGIQEQRIFWLGLLLATFGLLLSLPFSRFLWETVPWMKYVQFPWRFQPFVALGGALALAATLRIRHGFSFYRRLLMVGVLFWVVAANLFMTVVLSLPKRYRIPRPPMELLHMQAQPLTPAQYEIFQKRKDAYTFVYLANHKAYRPRGADDMIYPAVDRVGGISFVSGSGRVTRQRLSNTHREFRVQVETPSTLRLETYSYPHWVISLDGMRMESRVEPGSGLMLVDVPPGEYSLTLDYEIGSLTQRLSKVSSLFAWALLLFWLPWQVWPKVRSRGRFGQAVH